VEVTTWIEFFTSLLEFGKALLEFFKDYPLAIALFKNPISFLKKPIRSTCEKIINKKIIFHGTI
tara:strand:+ start:500 stop:691 length:192 start_codon:yes stop_codon:yes gene_type:complete